MVMPIDMTTTLGLCAALTTIAAACVVVKQHQRDGTGTSLLLRRYSQCPWDF